MSHITNTQRAQWAYRALLTHWDAEDVTLPADIDDEEREVRLEIIRDLVTNLQHFMRLALGLDGAARAEQMRMAIAMAEEEEQEDSDV